MDIFDLHSLSEKTSSDPLNRRTGWWLENITDGVRDLASKLGLSEVWTIQDEGENFTVFRQWKEREGKWERAMLYRPYDAQLQRTNRLKALSMIFIIKTYACLTTDLVMVHSRDMLVRHAASTLGCNVTT